MTHSGKRPPARPAKDGSFNASRLLVLGFIFSCLFLGLVIRLYRLQILEGSTYQAQYISNIQKKQRIPGIRGRIFDRNGVLLAESRLSYDLELEDINNYRTKTDRQGTLNGITNRLLELVGDEGKLNTVLPISADENGEYIFTSEGVRLNRFKADLMGKAYIEDLTEQESSMTASEIIDYLCAEDMFMIAEDNTLLYTSNQRTQYDVPDHLSRTRLLEILNIRYGLSLNSYRKYMAFTVAGDISEKTMAAVLENQSTLPGAKIEQGSQRTYYGGESMSGILGYTGLISAGELEQYGDSDIYDSQSKIGKSGIEKSMEEWLRGRDGEEEFYTDVVGHKKTNSEITAAAETGKDVYLTIDRDLQDAVYQMLEQQIAGILLSNMVNTKRADMPEAREAAQIRISIDDVFIALFKNHVIDVETLGEDGASPWELAILNRFKTQTISFCRRSLMGTLPRTS